MIAANRSGRSVSSETLSRSTPGRGQRLGAAGEADAVGGERDVRTRPQGRRRRDDALEPAAQQRLAAGEAQLVHAEVADRDRDEPDELVVGELLVARHPVEAFGGHAVGAAEVAAVGQGDAEVGRDAPERVDEAGVGGSGGVAAGRAAQRGKAQLGCRHTTSVTVETDLQPASDQREYVTPQARCRRAIRAADAGPGPGRTGGPIVRWPGLTAQAVGELLRVEVEAAEQVGVALGVDLLGQLGVARRAVGVAAAGCARTSRRVCHPC